MSDDCKMNETNLHNEARRASLEQTTRRHFLRDCGTGLGALWWATNASGGPGLPQHSATNPLNALTTPFAPRAKRVIHLHMIGAPSQLELFEEKTVILGLIAIAKTRVEPVEEIRARLGEALSHIDRERLIAGPDCGLGMLDLATATSKLANLTAAASALD